MKSDFIRYDTVTTKWRLDNVVIRSIDEDGTQHLRRERRIDTTLALLPEDLATIIYNAEMMPTPELNEFIRAEQLRGSENVNYFIIEKLKRTSWPASTYILVLIALSSPLRRPEADSDSTSPLAWRCVSLHLLHADRLCHAGQLPASAGGLAATYFRPPWPLSLCPCAQII